MGRFDASPAAGSLDVSIALNRCSTLRSSMMMIHIRAFIKTYHLAILSGILIGTSYIPFQPWALGFALVPLFLVSSRLDCLKQVFLAGWITQFVLTLIGFHWIAVVSIEYGHLPAWAGILVTLLFASAMHIYYPIALVAAKFAQRKFNLSTPATVVLMALSLAVIENLWPGIFPWNLGYPLLWAKSGLAQWADVIGFSGLSAAVLLLNAIVALFFLPQKKPHLKLLALAVAVLIIGLEVTGRMRERAWTVTDRSKKVMVVQANIGNLEKYYAERGAGFQQQIMETFFRLTRQGLNSFPESELVIWPESAVPDYLNSYHLGRKYSSQLLTFLREIKKPLLTGAYSKDAPGTKNPKDYNGMFLFDGAGTLLAEPYHKTILLIFGEYIPYGDRFPLLAKLNPGGAGFGRGQGPTVMNLGDDKIGVQICYESLYPDFSAGLALQDANYMVNLTNDSWFSSSRKDSWFHTSFEAHQHMLMTLARAVEVRRPLIRSTNTGISTAILASGQILEQGPTQTEWYQVYDIRYKSQPSITFYTRFGAWLVWLLLLMCAVVIAGGRKRESLS